MHVSVGLLTVFNHTLSSLIIIVGLLLALRFEHRANFRLEGRPSSDDLSCSATKASGWLDMHVC